jgi:hypothetical protein
MNEPPGNAKPGQPGRASAHSSFRYTLAQHQPAGNSKDFEDRRNAAACFRNQRKTEDWHPAYQGVMVVEGFRDGDKLWVNVHVRTSRKGEKYVSVVLKPQTARS